MAKIIDRTGEINLNKQGIKMKIVNYRNASDIDIQFEDGIIVKNKRYDHFQDGGIKHPNSKGNRFINRIGENNVNNQGLKMTIIKYRSSNDIDVQFEDGYIAEHKTFKNFRTGKIRNFNTYHTNTKSKHKIINGMEYKYCDACGKWKAVENFCKHKRRWDSLNSTCMECSNKNRIEWGENNKEHIRQYNEVNKEKYRQYRQSPQGRVNTFNAQCQRRPREEINGGKISKEQWLECMKYFGFRDAYSGEILDKDTRSLDHIQPVSRGGTNNIWNLVPTTRINNSSKNNKDMLLWYKKQSFFNEERLNKIYEWIKYAKNKYAEEKQLKWF